MVAFVRAPTAPAVPPKNASLSSRQACTLRPLVQAPVLLMMTGTTVPSGCATAPAASGHKTAASQADNANEPRLVVHLRPVQHERPTAQSYRERRYLNSSNLTASAMACNPATLG